MESIGRYTVLRKIGSGGMAEVFLARSLGAQGTEKLLVIKKIHPALAKNAKFIGMFVDEARLAMRLNHSNLVQVYNFEQIGDHYILAMEFVDGFDLLELEATVREKRIRFPFGIAAYIAQEVAKGLDYAHSRCDDRGRPLEIVHRDVSPQNILISRQGAIKIGDFGVARARWLHEEAKGTIKGKFGYMSPEQAGGKKVDARSDIYSLGVVLWEMLVGRPLVKFNPGDDPLEIIREAEYPTPRQADPSVPVALDQLVATAMARNPAERFQTTRQMAAALARYLHSENEIYDGPALEGWIAENAPPRELAGGPETEGDTTAVRSPMRRPSEQPLVASRNIGDVEQRPTVLVSGQFDIESSASGIKVAGEIQRLVGEMAFKAEGVLRDRPTGFSIYLGLLRSSMEDPIQGIRLASDVLDATRAVSRDHELKIGVRLAVSRGIVSCLADPSNPFPKFDPNLDLSEGESALLGAARADEIVVDDSIRQLAKREYNFDGGVRIGLPRGERESTAGSKGPRAFRLEGARSRQERREELQSEGPFQGREFELEQLDQAFRAAKKNRPVLVRVVGETGIGKSRLVSRFIETAHGENVQAFRTECLFAEQNLPLTSAAALIRETLGLFEADPDPALRSRLDPLLARAPRYLERQVRFLEQFLVSADAVWERYPGDRRELIRRTASCLGILIALLAARRPLIFVVDNAHWLDEQSIDVLREMLGQNSAVPVLAIFVGLDSAVSEQQLPGISTIEVKELPDPLLKRLVLERLGPAESMDPIADQILLRAQGNPFFANEIIDSLVQQRILVRDPGQSITQYRQARPGTIGLPATMEGIASSRIEALTKEQRAVLRTASAIGDSFTLDVLAALMGRDVSEEVHALVSIGLFVPLSADPDRPASYHFRQPMVRESAYGGLPVQDRQRIHQEMATRLIADAKKGVPVPKVRIAWHLDRSGDTEAAGRYYLAAGKAAIRLHSDREALRLYDRAIQRLKEDSRQRLDALVRREWVLRELGRHKEQAQDLMEMERISLELGNDALASHAKIRQALHQYDLCDFTGAAKRLQEALRLAIRGSDSTQQIEALRLLAYVAVEEGHLVRALDCCNRALAIIPEGKGDLPMTLRGRSLGIKGFVLYNMGYLDQAATPLAESLFIFRTVKARRYESQTLSNLALLAKARGEMTDALEFLESAMRIDRDVADASHRGRKFATLASIRTDLGDLQTAHAHARESRAICKANRERFGEVDADLVLARLLIMEGDPALAREILENVEREGVVTLSRQRLVMHRQLAAKATLFSGFPALARQLAEEATRIALQAGMHGEAVYGGVLLARILGELGLHGKSLGALHDANKMLNRLGGVVYRAEEVWWLKALSYHRAGEAEDAERTLQRARKEVARRRALIRDQALARCYDNHPIVRSIRDGLPPAAPAAP